MLKSSRDRCSQRWRDPGGGAEGLTPVAAVRFERYDRAGILRAHRVLAWRVGSLSEAPCEAPRPGGRSARPPYASTVANQRRSAEMHSASSDRGPVPRTATCARTAARRRHPRAVTVLAAPADIPRLSFPAMPIATINPATGETLRTFTPLTPAELEARLECAASAYRRHRRTRLRRPPADDARGRRILETEKEAFGRLMVTEMGKPLKAAIEEAAKCALGCRYYAENAERFLADETIETSATQSWVAYQPIGPVLAVMPWNFPFWQVFRFAAPALMAGNVGLLKHASNVPQCALAIEDIFRRAGFPEGCFQTLLIETDQVKRRHRRSPGRRGDAHRQHRRRQQRGERRRQGDQEVGARAGRQRSVHRDAERRSRDARCGPRSRRAPSTTASRASRPSGSSCTRRSPTSSSGATSRDSRRSRSAIRWTRPPTSARSPTRARCSTHRRAGRALGGGGRASCSPAGGGSTGRASGTSRRCSPTSPPDSPAYHDEVFGPVAILFRARNVDEAIRLANDSPFGLGASAWTTDAAERQRFVDEIEAGHGLHQRHGGVGPAGAVRRREAVAATGGSWRRTGSASS